MSILCAGRYCDVRAVLEIEVGCGGSSNEECRAVSYRPPHCTCSLLLSM